MPPSYRYFTLHPQDKDAALFFLILIILTAAIQMLFNYYLKRKSFNEKTVFRSRLFFNLIIILLFFISLEYIAAHTSQKIIKSERLQPYEMDMKLLWRIKSNSVNRRWDRFVFNTDSNSIRSSDEIPFKKEKNEIRILHLGDSWAFGFALNDDQTYSYHLDKLLKEKYPNKKITSINAGCWSHCLAQGAIYLEHRGFKYDPDIIVFKNYLNQGVLDAFLVIYPYHNSFSDRIRSLLWKSNLYLYLRRLNLIKLHGEFKDQVKPVESGVDVRKYELDLYNHVVDMSEKHGAELIFLNLGLQRYDEFLAGSSIVNVAQERNIPIVSVQIDQTKDPIFFEHNDTHPGPNSAKDIADTLFQFFVENRLLEKK